MSGNYRRNTNFGAAANTAAPPSGMDDYIHDIGQFPVQTENLRKFAYHYNEDLDAFKGHEIIDHEINGVKHNIPVPPTVASKIALTFMLEHPVMLHQMIQKSYRERSAPNKMGKFVPKTVLYYNRAAANLGFDKVARSMSFHGTKMFLEHEIDAFDEDRPTAIDAIYSQTMVTKMHGEIKEAGAAPSRRRRQFKHRKLAGGSMLLEDKDERKKLKDAMYPFEKFVSEKVDEEDDDDEDESHDDDDNDDDGDDDDMDEDDDDNDDLDRRNERRHQKGKIKKKPRRKSTSKPKKKVLPFKKKSKKPEQNKSTASSREVDIDLSLVEEERARRQSTAAATARSAEKHKGKQVRGVAQNSKKRKTLAAELNAAEVPFDDIFGQTPKKPWSDHPKFHEYVSKAGTYVERLGFSSPSAGSTETMHSLARKLDIQLAAKKQPSKKILIQAIVITKLKQLDPTNSSHYQ